jgi:hypothetical protein
MRTAAICPTCATYVNALCVIYDGEALPNTEIPPMTSIQDALALIDGAIGAINANFANGYSGTVDTGNDQTLTFANGLLISVV